MAADPPCNMETDEGALRRKCLFRLLKGRTLCWYHRVSLLLFTQHSSVIGTIVYYPAARFTSFVKKEKKKMTGKGVKHIWIPSRMKDWFTVYSWWRHVLKTEHTVRPGGYFSQLFVKFHEKVYWEFSSALSQFMMLKCSVISVDSGSLFSKLREPLELYVIISE